jgi:hypothetical protein
MKNKFLLLIIALAFVSFSKSDTNKLNILVIFSDDHALQEALKILDEK